MINQFKCFWYVDGTRDDWPMTVEADGMDIQSITIPVRLDDGKRKDMRFVPEPPTCTMEPDGYYGEEYGIYKCSNCGELWQFECDGPKEHGWVCCPHCRATIKEDK